MSNLRKRPVIFILAFYLICFIFRGIEYIFIRTDQGFIGENFIHKLIGIALLAVAVWLLQYKWSEIGFKGKAVIKNLVFGFLFGCAVYAVAYGTELILLISADNAPNLQFYVSRYSALGNVGMETGVQFILICIAGNIINVIMEEGVFRGLFMKLAEEKYSFIKACLLSSVLFGLWHIAQPARNVIDGEQSLPGALMMGLMLVGTSMLGGIQYVLLYKLTGSLWFGMAAHFVNNAIVNMLHVVTVTGADEMQTVRITIAQTLSCVIVLVVFLVKYMKQRKKSISKA